MCAWMVEDFQLCHSDHQRKQSESQAPSIREKSLHISNHSTTHTRSTQRTCYHCQWGGPFTIPEKLAILDLRSVYPNPRRRLEPWSCLFCGSASGIAECLRSMRDRMRLTEGDMILDVLRCILRRRIIPRRIFQDISIDVDIVI